MKIKTTIISDFANRLRYTQTSNLPENVIVDHVNKEYNINANPYHILFDIIFWNTPPFVYNVVKLSLKHQFGYDMTLDNLAKAIEKLDLKIIPTKYRNTNLFKILHPCIDVSLRTDFTKVIDILLCRAFDEEDSYFNTFFPDYPTSNMVKLLNPNQHMFLVMISNVDAILSGSFAMSMYGDIYRTDIKDFDLLVDYKYLPNDILDLVNEELTYNKIVGKDRIKTEQEVKSKFVTCEFFNKLNKIFHNKLEIQSAVVDRVAEYDNVTKVTFIIKYEDIEFDLIFRTNVEYETFNIPIQTGLGEILYEGKVKVQDINEVLFTKRLLGRPKDFQDLINFKPYKRLYNNNKCVVNYG